MGFFSGANCYRPYRAEVSEWAKDMGSFQVAQLESLFQSRTGAGAPDFKAALDRLHSELITRESRSLPESKDFFLSSVKALKKFKGGNQIESRLRCLEICLRYFFYHGDSGFCLDIANEHRALASLMGSPSTLRLSLSLLGMVYADMGNLAEALPLYANAIEISRKVEDATAECMVLNNLGTALNYAGLYEEAILCFNRILEFPPSNLRHGVDKSALSNLAQSHYYLENFEDALKAISKCVDRAPTRLDADGNFRQTIREFVFVQVALELGLTDRALEHSSRCTKHAIASSSERCQLMAQIAGGLCSVRIGDVGAGLHALESALARSQRLDSSYRDALIAIVKGYDEASQPAMALKYIEKLLDHTRQHRTAAINTLVSLRQNPILTNPIAERHFQALERRQAILRVRAAEREALESKLEMLERLAVTADLREDASGAHGYRVGRLSALFASTLGWSQEATKSLEIAARIHDIGKTAIPDRILGSSDVLKGVERRLMCTHTEIGAELLGRSEVPELKLAERIARSHHECWDGSGYPDSLKGRQIPIEARIVALADVFDALTHGRPFSAPWPFDSAIEEIRHRDGRQFDPNFTGRFVSFLVALSDEHHDIESFLSAPSIRSPFLRARRRIRELLAREINATALRV
jgi:putative two-component system response regulator